MPPRLPFPPPTALAARTLSAALSREPWARERLARHAGKTVRLALGGFALSLTIAADGTLQAADPAIVPDVTLSVVPERLTLERLRPGPASQDAVAEMTRIDGDAALAQVVADLARQLRPDPEDILAERIGDIPAARLAGAARTAAAGLREAAGRLAGNVAEYLSEESRLLAGRAALAALSGELAAERERLGALAARADRLDKRLDERLRGPSGRAGA